MPLAWQICLFAGILPTLAKCEISTYVIVCYNITSHLSEGNFFMPPKELWEAYSNRTVRPSVRPCVRTCVRPAFVSGPYLLYSLR